ncbi:hypothetical protein OH76DRAFT_1404944 [Lentinus brumalis]|uniref:Uncharacterized protein n=1 Tax=Lentinus brumalis TaxID=2498619 RepID=A0A371D761_9APHY|nr:hypothetical protein OH76DRAFT_1404944 [Polyporus brumalis]
MFELFKKEDFSKAVLRKERVGKNVKRPKTAPAAFSATPKSTEDLMADTAVGRHSADGGSVSQHSLHGSPKPLRNPYERSTSQTALDIELPALPSRPTLRRPVSDRSLSATSCELRNPFRSDTSDSVTTVSMSRASSFVEAVTPVQRTVLTQFPEQIEGTMAHLPHKAAIFTIPAHGLGISSGDSSGTEHPVLSTMLTASSIDSVADVAEASGSVTPKRGRWSFLKSPKHSAQDFLQVHIPSGVFSPPTRDRQPFWSRL